MCDDRDEQEIDENFRFSQEGIFQWFSSEHAAEKFKDIALDLARVGGQLDKVGKKSRVADKVWAIHEEALKYSQHYSQACPVRSVRVQLETGAVFVTLADGEDVFVSRNAK